MVEVYRFALIAIASFIVSCTSCADAARTAPPLDHDALKATAKQMLASGSVPYFISGDATVDEALATAHVYTVAKQPRNGEMLATHTLNAVASNPAAAFAAHLCRAHARGCQYKFVAARDDIDAAILLLHNGIDNENGSNQRRHLAIGNARAAAGDLSGAVDAFEVSCKSVAPGCQRITCTTEAAIRMADVVAVAEELLRRVSEAELNACTRYDNLERYWLIRGKQEYRIGKMEESVKSLDKCLALRQDDSMWLSPFRINCASMLAILWTDISDLPRAEAAYDLATRVDKPNSVTLVSRRGKLYKLYGMHKFASDDFEACMSDPELRVECTVLAAQSHHVRGEFGRAFKLYSQIAGHGKSPKSGDDDTGAWSKWQLRAWHGRELMLVECLQLHSKANAESRRVSEASYTELLQGAMLGKSVMSPGYKSLSDSKSGSRACPKRIKDSVSSDAMAVFEIADSLGPLFQVAAPGFAASRWRQQAFAIAAIEVAQRLVSATDALIDTNDVNVWPSFREAFSIPLRWRQAAASDDTAFWLDDMVSLCIQCCMSLRVPPRSTTFFSTNASSSITLYRKMFPSDARGIQSWYICVANAVAKRSARTTSVRSLHSTRSCNNEREYFVGA